MVTGTGEEEEREGETKIYFTLHAVELTFVDVY